ncbi:TlpA family protein disulfide reductase [Flagellimonas myxillae]|uniref:TlpA family protein disulfide reductase n=1 Tax=Flagellimonas myxillae TaxID=2942214 RepID=UPI00201F238C|nr:transaldolase [Muricauda myxillae]MCL6265712.1 transaldolase [Muricauda myxillae]
MIRILLGLSLFSILACTDRSGECPTVFFGGEIVNPTSDYVVLYRNDTYIDSAKLDTGNRFSFKLQGIEEGLYHFDHSPELQYLYLQEGDSILIRLNTMEFDESLVFSGEGSEINNFLIEMFLAHEQEEHEIYGFYHLPPMDFQKKIDSLQEKKLAHLNELITENQLSEKAIGLATASVNYQSFTHRESYPFYHKKKTGKETFPELPEEFYSYRKSVDLNNRELAYFRPYFDYVKYHFGNISYMACMKGCGGMEGKESMGRLHYNKHKLTMVDSLVSEDELRNLLFRNIAMDYLLREHSASKECQIFIEKFRKLSSSDDHKQEIDDLYEGIQNLQPNSELPELIVTNVENQEVSIKDISKKQKTVFYFWTGAQKRHLKNVTQHVAKLQKKHPEYRFVGINVKTSYTQWQNLLEEYGLDKADQFHGDDFEEIQTSMILDDLYKCVIAKDTLVVDAFASLYYSF